MKVKPVKPRTPRRFAPIAPTSASKSTTPAITTKSITVPPTKPSIASSALARFGLTLVPLLLIVIFNAGLPSSSSQSRPSSHHHHHHRTAPLSRHYRDGRQATSFSSARYDLARLLNIRHFANLGAGDNNDIQDDHHAPSVFVPRRSLVARYHRLARAARCPAMSGRSPPHVSVLRSALARVPVSAPRIRLLRALWARGGGSTRAKWVSMISRNDVLTVHLPPPRSPGSGFRSGGPGSASDHDEAYHVQCIQRVLLRRSHLRVVVLFAFPFRFIAPAALAAKLQNVTTADGSAVKVHVYSPGRSAAVLPTTHADAQLAVLSRAAFLLVGGGPEAALAAVAATTGKVFVTRLLRSYTDNTYYRWLLHNATLIDSEDDRTGRLAMRHVLSGMGRVVPSCCAFVSFGAGEAEKQVCTNERGRSIANAAGVAPSSRKKRCWVLAIGCGNEWSFEQSVLARTSCSVQLFDCTVPFSVPSHVRDRVTLHRLCLSNTDKRSGGSGSTTGDNGAVYIPLREMLKLGARSAGLRGTRPTLVKIDAEGYEVGGLAAFVSAANRADLPPQILAEFHAASRFADVGAPYVLGTYSNSAAGMLRDDVKQWFGTLRRRGYVVVHREDSAACAHCSEITLMQRWAVRGLAMA